jgi:hypothetical protein
MTVLFGSILAGGIPVNGTLYLTLSAPANLAGGACGSGTITQFPPFIFNLTNGQITGPGSGAYTVPGADCLNPANLTYAATVTAADGHVILQQTGLVIQGATANLSTLL